MTDYLNDPRVKKIALVRWNDVLDRPSVEAQELALRVLTEAALTEEGVKELKSNGAIPKVVNLISNESEVLQMYACWFTSNMCDADDEEIRMAFYDAGTLEKLLPLLQSNNLLLLEKITWVLTNLALNDYIRQKIIDFGFLAPLMKLLVKSKEVSTKALVLRPLINILLNEFAHEPFINSEAMPIVTQLLSSENHVAQKAALTVLFMISASSDAVRQAMISKYNILQPLSAILELDYPEARDAKLTALQLLVNLSYTDANELPMAQSGILLPVADLLSSDDASLQTLAAMLLANLCINPKVREGVRSFGWAQSITKLLSSDGELQLQTLRFISNVAIDPYCRKLLLDAGALPSLKTMSTKSNLTKEVSELVQLAISNLSVEIPTEILDMFKVEEVEISVPEIKESFSNTQLGAALKTVASDSLNRSVNSFFLGDSSKLLANSSPILKSPSNSSLQKKPGEGTSSSSSNIAPADNTKSLPDVIPVRKATIRKDPADAPLYARRERVARELLETERTYVATLDTIKTGFLLPLRQAARDGKPILTDVEIHKLFSVCELLHQIHSAFLAKLEARLAGWTWETCIADLFIDVTEMFKAYKPYINNYDSAIEFYSKDASKRKAWVTFMKDATEKYPELRGAGLSHYLIQPIQRLPRYMLLLDQLIKFTPPHHIDHRNLDLAYNKVKRITEYLNEAKRNAESSNKIMEIDIKLTGLQQQLMVAGRRFVKEGSLLEERKGGSRYVQVYLFSDLLVIAVPEKKFKRSSSNAKSGDQNKNLKQYRVVRALTLPTDVNSVDLDARETKFKVNFRPTLDPDGDGVLQLVAVSAAERMSWVTTLQETLEQSKNAPPKRITTTELELNEQSGPIARSSSLTSVQRSSTSASTTPTNTSAAESSSPSSPSPSTTTSTSNTSSQTTDTSAQLQQLAQLQQQMAQLQSAFMSKMSSSPAATNSAATHANLATSPPNPAAFPTTAASTATVSQTGVNQTSQFLSPTILTQQLAQLSPEQIDALRQLMGSLSAANPPQTQ